MATTIETMRKADALAFVGVPKWDTKKGDWFVLQWHSNLPAGRLTFIVRHPNGPDGYWEWIHGGKKSGTTPTPVGEWRERLDAAIEEVSGSRSSLGVKEWIPEIAAWLVEFRSDDAMFHTLAPDAFFVALQRSKNDTHTRRKKRRA